MLYRCRIWKRNFVIPATTIICLICAFGRFVSLKAFRRKLLFHEDKHSAFANSVRKLEASSPGTVINISLPEEKSLKSETDFDCAAIEKVLTESKKDKSKVFRQQNQDGNRGIYFTRTYNERLNLFEDLVIKEATLGNSSDEHEVYRYNSALREVANLRRLDQLGFQGAPALRGSCVTHASVTYVVTRITDAEPVCSGEGTDMRCALLQDILHKISLNLDRGQAALEFLKQAVCFFSQFENNHIFMEDISGANFYYSPKTWELYLVDADSLVFYEDWPLLSRVSCRTNTDCPLPKGNLWPCHALVRKIYYGCEEMYGFCLNNTCQGIDARLHTCGIGRWLVASMRNHIPVLLYNEYRILKDCMSNANPALRCSLKYSCAGFESMLLKYKTSHARSA